MKTKALPFEPVFFSVLILVACNTAGEVEPTAALSVMTTEQAVVAALTDYLEGQGAPVSQINLMVLGSMMNNIDPRVIFAVEELAGRNLEQIGEEFLADYEGFDIERTR